VGAAERLVFVEAGLWPGVFDGKGKSWTEVRPLQRHHERAGLKPSLYRRVCGFQGGVQFVRGNLYFIHSMVCDPDKG
jgi:hypothetical protein